ncbi:4-galactosyl-N-acetylglucosaminide 3-alpha-L-fucosyltransferase 9-like [Cololabis saira]|uniref:4-galactosyl-N-acetylglucosaminide 3-alpha-L-fucosyltransferase 9-like n=1 Tax=Cololabis saira TaxID=129043 RepID=UPI002AD3E1FE|nr:4-galactosyl-N-acetylglucosaminide 3-alpha-L-fucosyltransferase 9-like [Cololabis saira]XP_061600394.1 4-galactosyl-N-acetylglucosaminide 3-alpha-L-fucosyltransferase 9-like [Cololabis saira]
MSVTANHKTLRPLLVTTIILGVFVAAFLMYIKPSTSMIYELAKSKVSTVQVIQPNSTVVLVWLWPFGKTFDLSVCSSHFKIEGCVITADRSLYSKSHGVIIHHHDISANLSNLPRTQRPPFQKWIWMNMESPTHSPKHPGIGNLFNLTLNYRRDADIALPYGSIIAAETKNFVPPTKDKLICWFVSNWNQDHERVKYYDELKNHVEIHAYGNAFGSHISDEDYFSTMGSCKFYLAFENSIHKDYMTEKLYNPLSVGTVPVVLGPPRKNYENFVPGNAFIHVDDFSSPKELAEYLLLLDQNMAIYLQYFEWRRHFEARKTYFWAELTCRACDYLKRQKVYQAFNSLDNWYWGQ